MAGSAVFHDVEESTPGEFGACGAHPSDPHQKRIDRVVLGFVALGVALRVGHYLTNYPLWGDEAFLAINFVRRGYLDLLAPLDYGQICPILFLWAELTAVKLFGFSELSLRLVPLVCAVGSVFLFRRVATRLLTGVALVMAVAIFAVSLHPIRHGADAKPYASDLLVSLGLLTLAVEWWRRPGRTRALWLLVGFVPLALAASYPAALVATGIAPALAPSVWRTRRWGPIIWLAVYVLALVATIAILKVGHTDAQRNGATLPGLQRYWAGAFPPLDSPLPLASWLIATHAGSMFAYPWGGGRGASSGTLVLVVVAAVALWRQGRRTVLALLMLPMAVALAAAALRLYPYGVQARTMQYLAPAICLLAGLGLSTVLGRLNRPPARAVMVRITVTTLAVVGIATVADGFRHPYRAVYDHQAREFARRFWPQQAQAAELACLQWDFGIRQKRTAVARTALYLCNQHIYSPSRRRRDEPLGTNVTPARPLRCVVFDDSQLNRPETTAWLAAMKKTYRLRRRIDLAIPTTGLDSKPWDDHVFIFEFEAKRGRPTETIAVEKAGERTAL
jgi:hypothetical protein